MAYFKLEQNKKGLCAKIQVFSKDLETSKDKIYTKRIYNEKNLTEAKFEKFVEKYSREFEEEIQTAYKERNDKLKSRVLTFAQLGKEFIANIKTNLSISYYIRATDVVKRFNNYLESINLHKDPINVIKVRDVQMFLNSFQSYERCQEGSVKLIKDLPSKVNYRLLAQEKIIDRCTSYEMRRRRKHINSDKAKKICEIYGLTFNEYFEVVNTKTSYSTETIKGYRRVLRTIFNEALRYEWINKNPVCQTKVGAGSGNTSLREVHEKEVFSIQEAKDFIQTLNEMDDDFIFKKVVLKFMILTGVRIGEMCGLKWCDIDFTKKWFT